MSTTKIYFPNLNGLRFIAAFLVIIHHLEMVKCWFGIYPNTWSLSFIQQIGKLGVILFFVLSGFLITYLLLVEEQKTKTVSIKDFYIRRILRIWPLYYLVVGIAFFLIPNVPSFNTIFGSIDSSGYPLYLFLYIVFLPNVVLYSFAFIPYATQAWSVGVEEQFYLLWPILMKRFRNKKRLLICIILIYLIIKLAIYFLADFYKDGWLGSISNVWNNFNIDCMAIGGLFAWSLFERKKILDYIYHPIVKWGSLILVCIAIGFAWKVPFINYEVYSVFFGIVILNFASNPSPYINLENKVISYLGKISYGLYMYHIITLSIAVKILRHFEVSSYLLQLTFGLSLTILVSVCSYEFYEKYFIKLKMKYSKIISGDNARKI